MKWTCLLILLMLFVGCASSSKTAVQEADEPTGEALTPVLTPKAEPLKFVNTTEKLLGIADFPEPLEIRRLEDIPGQTGNSSLIEMGSSSMNVTNRVSVYPSPSYAIFGGYGFATSERVLKEILGGDYSRIEHETIGDDSNIYEGRKDGNFVYRIVIRRHILVSEITITSSEDFGTDRILEIGEKSAGNLVL